MLIVKGGDKDVEFQGLVGEICKTPASYKLPKKENATFYGYFYDEAFTQPFEFPYTYEAGEKVIYAKFLEGTWSIVRTPAEFTTAISTNKNIYLDADLDYTNVAWTKVGYSGEINGNGHKISNVSLALEASKNNQSGFALFTRLSKTAYIHDLTIENAYIEFSIKQVLIDMKVSLLAYEAEAGARLSKVNLSGEIKKGTFITGSDGTLCEQPIAIDNGAIITDCVFNVALNLNEENN